MDENLAMAIIETLGEKICALQDAVKNLREYIGSCDKQRDMLIKRVRELESRDGEPERAECDKI